MAHCMLKVGFLVDNRNGWGATKECLYLFKSPTLNMHCRSWCHNTGIKLQTQATTALEKTINIAFTTRYRASATYRGSIRLERGLRNDEIPLLIKTSSKMRCSLFIRHRCTALMYLFFFNLETKYVTILMWD